ncbi:sensor histidine kinase [Thalassoglobus neptunius]|uniref:sensor histidine kinase n=1 Tax=Thalassoglobus neptunius TaxID=1938619 RepID=UPI001E4C05BE|nr:HAMP domain-containing sensor histidine kinase [Thalassoglobus neptunius]
MTLPLLLLGWAGLQLLNLEDRQVEENIRGLLTDRLTETKRILAAEMQSKASEMEQLTSIDSYDVDSLREIVRNDPRLFQLFVIDPNDFLVYPDPRSQLNKTEREFLLNASSLINDRLLQKSALETQSDPPDAKQEEKTTSLNLLTLGASPGKFVQAEEKQPPTAGRWFVWYWGPGFHLIYWQRRPNGYLVGAALDRSKWISDLIAELPDTSAAEQSPKAAPSQSQIVESGSKVIYKWGGFRPTKGTAPSAELQLPAPLTAWELQTFVPAGYLTSGKNGVYVLISGLVLSTLALSGLAFLIDREYGREARQAEQRVSFVNQVSHELRTPLTNIRMYAELLERDLENVDTPSPDSVRRLNVILNESHRLSRLIGNVLTFARQDKQSLRVCPRMIVPDDTVLEVVERFRPVLDRMGIETVLALNAKQSMAIDPDLLEQILENLISNVEKYASNGQWMRIETGVLDERLFRLVVSDRGPGLPDNGASRVFEPFWRGTDEISQAAGTGIGLTIVRSLARLHGGDATIGNSDAGASFIVELREATEV